MKNHMQTIINVCFAIFITVHIIQDDKLNWQHISDLKKWESIVVSAYQIEGIPFNILIDPTGKVIATDLRGDALQNTLASILQ